MKDRVSKYPGRVKMIPVKGQTNTFDMVRADEPEQEGTPLNKNAFLTDDVAALYGLDGNATPNKAFMVLSGVVGADFVNKNVWVATEYTPAGKTISLGSEAEVTIDSKTGDEISGGAVLSATVFRTKEVSASADGGIIAENVSSVVVTADSDVLSGYFWSKNNVFTSSNTYYTPEGETTTVSEYGPGETIFTLSVAAQRVSVVDTEEKTGTASVRYGSAGQYPNYGFVEDFAAYPYAGYKYQGYGPFKNIPLYIGSGTGGGGGVPVPGEPGATFVPSVSAEGVISWTNDGGLANPEPVNLVAAVLAALPNGDDVEYPESEEVIASYTIYYEPDEDGTTWGFSSGSGWFWHDNGVHFSVGDTIGFSNDSSNGSYKVTNVYEDAAQGYEYHVAFDGTYTPVNGDMVSIYQRGS